MKQVLEKARLAVMISEMFEIWAEYETSMHA